MNALLLSRKQLAASPIDIMNSSVHNIEQQFYIMHILREETGDVKG
jgi:hypothetical protein